MIAAFVALVTIVILGFAGTVFPAIPLWIGAGIGAVGAMGVFMALDGG